MRERTLNQGGITMSNHTSLHSNVRGRIFFTVRYRLTKNKN